MNDRPYCRVELPAATDLLALHAANPQAFPGLLESVAQRDAADDQGSDLLFALPGAAIELSAEALIATDAPIFLRELDAAFTQQAVAPAPRDDAPIFFGGWMLLLGYELAHQIESRVPVLQPPAGQAGVPVALAVRCRGALIRSRASGQVTLVYEAGVSQHEIDALRAQIDAAPAASKQPVTRPAATQVEPAAPLITAIGKIHDYVRAGDVFQVNLSRGWRSEYAAAPDVIASYQRLRQDNPGPFAGVMQWNDTAVLSSSPERLVRVTRHADGARIETRPIAGTRRRGTDAAADSALAEELLGHPKERAEHIMLIDLERNDLGRVCVPGSVAVDELMVVESYAHVHHIVSNVSGQLRDGVGPGQAIAAVFPGGTITGCPKVRCMQIIAELEAAARGPYTGAMGYLGVDGQMDLNILIRSLVFAGTTATVRAGAGIVIDSDPAAELREMQAKARGLLPALGIEPALGLADIEPSA